MNEAALSTYCPVLKAKAGELEALRKLPGTERDQVALVLDPDNC